MTATSFTNSSLATARGCLTKYDLRYNLRLERATEEESEALAVGTCWHKAHEAAAKEGGRPYSVIAEHAPSSLWSVKLQRLFAAYEWYWADEVFEVVEPEKQFCIENNGVVFEGKNDGIIKMDGRTGFIERKTTSEDIGPEANYWRRLRMDPQTGLYAAALGFVPAFVLYDVVRKPTINPKKLTKADVARLRKELTKNGSARYFNQPFTAAEIEDALFEGRENDQLYGARLTADIGDRPDYYFARRPVDHSVQDIETLMANLGAQVSLIRHAERNNLMHRNPDACATFGICTYFGLCSNNIRPVAGGPIPDGYREREKLHPELD